MITTKQLRALQQARTRVERIQTLTNKAYDDLSAAFPTYSREASSARMVLARLTDDVSSGRREFASRVEDELRASK